MTAIWGPLGWISLHSVADLYPNSPTESERTLTNTWLKLFADTITCPSCQEHFIKLFQLYKQRYPNFLQNRDTFLTFTFRAHNAVNKRLHKPIQSSVHECFEALRAVTKQNTARTYRVSYLDHIRRFWRTIQDVHGIAAIRKVNDMIKIEQDYFTVRLSLFETEIPEVDVVVPLVSKTDEDDRGGMRIMRAPPPIIQTLQQKPSPPNQERYIPALSFIGGRLRLR